MAMQANSLTADLVSELGVDDEHVTEVQAYVRSRQVASVYGQAPFALVCSVVAALVVATLSFATVPVSRLAAWAGLFAAVSGVRVFLIYAYRRKRTALSDHRWMQAFTVTIAAVGVNWTLAGIYLPQTGDSLLSALIVLCICGLVGGAAGTFSIALNVVFAFSLPAIVPVSVFLIASGDSGLLIGGVALTFLGAMSAMAIRMNKIALNELTLQRENARLLANFSASNEQMERLTTTLEERVVERTAALTAEIEERRKVEAQLNESEQQFRSTFEDAAIGMVVATPDGNTVAANRAVCAMVGYSEAELQALDSAEITHPDDRHLKPKSMTRFEQGSADTDSVEKRYIHCDGRVIWAQQTLSMVRAEDGEPRYVLVQVQDISERKAAEEELRRWQYILDSSTDLTAFVDSNYVYRAVNQAYPEYFGLDNEQIVGMSASELLGVEYFETTSQPSTDRALRGESVRQESWFEFPAAGRRYVEVVYNPFRDLAGEITGVVFCCRDLTDHRRIEEALQDSEGRADLALEAADLGWWDLNLVTGAESYSERWATMLGYSPTDSDPADLKWERLIHPQDKDRVLQQLQDHFDGETAYYRSEERLRSKSGEWKWIESHARVASRDEEGKALRVVGTHRDISEHKTAMSALYESEARFRSAFNEAGIAMALNDLDGRFLKVNSAMCELTGYSVEELLGMDWRSFTHPDELSEAEQRFTRFQRLMSGELASYSTETRYITKLGRTIWVYATIAVIRDETGQPVHLIAQNQDITAQKQANQALVDLQAVIRAVHDVTRDHALSLQAKIDRLLDAGRKHLVLEIGLVTHVDGDRNTIVQRRAPLGWSLSPGDEVPTELVAVEHSRVEVLKPGAANETSRGGVGIQTSICAPITVQSEFFGSLNFCSAITRERTYTDLEKELVALLAHWIGQELENDRTAKALAENEKLAATGRIAARVAHEINNPLAGIKNAFQLIKPGVAEDYPYYSYVGRIDRELQRIADIVREMFSLYRPGVQQRQVIELRELLADVVALLEPHGRQAQVQVTIATAEDLPRIVRVPEDALRQVLFNVMRNAIDASPPASTVAVGTQMDAGVLTISIADDGDGIAPEIAENIFEPFFTTKDVITNSLGLGLSVSRNLLEAAGGSLTFRSSVPARQTIFYIRLPVGPAAGDS